MTITHTMFDHQLHWLEQARLQPHIKVLLYTFVTEVSLAIIAPTVIIKCFPEGQTHRKLIPRSPLSSEEKGKQEHTKGKQEKTKKIYWLC